MNESVKEMEIIIRSLLVEFDDEFLYFPIDYIFDHWEEFDINFIREVKDHIDWKDVFNRIVSDNIDDTKEEILIKYHPHLIEFWKSYEKKNS